MDGMTAFRLTYDGPALVAHEMHPRDLAPVLVAISDLLEAAAHALYGDEVKVNVHIKGPFKSGSFNVDFVANMTWLKSVRDFFSGQGAAAVANATAILTAVGIIGRGLFSLLKWLRGRAISEIVPMAPDAQGFGRVRVHVGEDSYEIRRQALDLLMDAAVRTALECVIKPLEETGVDVLAIGTGGYLNVIIHGDERIYFVAPPEEEVLLIDDVRDMSFSIVSCTGPDAHHWRLSHGEATVGSRVSDEAFLQAMAENRVILLKEDILVCRTRIRQWKAASGIRTDYEIVQVNRHIRANRQIPLPLDVFPLTGEFVG